MAIRFRLLQSDNELQKLAKGFEEYVGACPPMAYIKASYAYGAFDGDTLVGGFTVTTGQSLRAFLFIPDSVKQELSFLKSTSSHDFVETNCTWLAPDYRKKHRTRFWSYLMKQVLKTGKPYYLISFSGKAKGLRKSYDTVISDVLYAGRSPLAKDGEDTYYSEIVVAYTTRARLMTAPIRNFWLWASTFLRENMLPNRQHKGLRNRDSVTSQP